LEGHQISSRLVRCSLKMTKNKTRKTIEYRQKSEKDLIDMLGGLKKDMEKNAVSILKGKEKNFKRNLFLRKEIARVFTVLTEKKILSQIEKEEK